MRERNSFSLAMMQPLVIIVGACFAPCAMDIFACLLAVHICYVLLFYVCVIVCVCVSVCDYLWACALVCVCCGYVCVFARLCARMV